MDAIAREYAGEAYHLFIYAREAHPEYARGLYEHFTSFEEKMERARILQERHNSPRKILVDGLEGEVHRKYAGLPNMNWVVDHTGTVVYKAAWTVAGEVRKGLEAALKIRELKREGKSGPPYYRELFSIRTVGPLEERIRMVREGPGRV